MYYVGSARLPRDAALIVRQITEAIGFLHSQGVVHRDLKPANLLLRDTTSFCVKVTDFGLSVAKQETEVATGASLGSPQWTAPELLRGKAADECADIYSYGLLVYEVTA